MPELKEQLGDAANILLGAPSMSQGTEGVCVDLLAQGPSEDASVLWVSFRKSASQCLAEWRGEHDVDPGSYGVIVVGDTAGTEDDGEVEPGAVQHISNPSDLTGIGIKVGEFVSGRSGQIVVCVDSLTALLQYVDLETAYEFVHALTGQLYSAGAVSHFHVDPTAHDRETIDTLLSLFDASVDLSDGDVDVRTRYPFE
ncbi:hypothetical protein ACFR9U_04460 [Halorientalis brevis]|uniref:RecA-superfamily ATPase, KaiC/GvpD/RAD55 family n=1 Tax=Halorientalis brevis TaxID=1126241 RepID=A0ABD6CA08_9EURY|nr:hypothetical protein [Halorientalis brevis]